MWGSEVSLYLSVYVGHMTFEKSDNASSGVVRVLSKPLFRLDADFGYYVGHFF